ncbi:MAG: DUF983 domain-containing protein [Sphingomicrobium sp.]
MPGPPPGEPSPLAAALSGTCPKCGEGPLFIRGIAFADRCRNCDLDFGQFNVGDGAAAFLILIIGALLTIGAITVELAFEPAYWVHLIWIPIGGGLTILGLRLAKAFLLAQEYRHRAREGRIVQ